MLVTTGTMLVSGTARPKPLTAPARGPAHLAHPRGPPAPLLPDALDPGFQCVRTHWIRGFMAFQLARRTRIVMLMVPV